MGRWKRQGPKDKVSFPQELMTFWRSQTCTQPIIVQCYLCWVCPCIHCSECVARSRSYQLFSGTIRKSLSDEVKLKQRLWLGWWVGKKRGRSLYRTTCVWGSMECSEQSRAGYVWTWRELDSNSGKPGWIGSENLRQTSPPAMFRCLPLVIESLK